MPELACGIEDERGRQGPAPLRVETVDELLVFLGLEVDGKIHPALRDVFLQFRRSGGGFTLEAAIWLPQKLARVFSFFADAGNLDVITPPWLRFEILTPRPIEMRVGTLIDYRLRLRGLPLRWRSEITAWDPPHRFVDEQRRSPYRLWQHEHTFAERDGGTLVGDHVRYAVFGGVVIERLFVRRDVTNIFTYRQEQLAMLFRQPG